MLEMKDVEHLPQIKISDTFVKLCDCLLAAVGVVNTDTGILVEISPAEKLIYARMYAAYKFHSENNRDYFESQDVIADSVGVERKKICIAVDKFVKLGILTQTTKYIRGLKRNFYVFHEFVDVPNIVFIKRFTTRVMTNTKIEVKKEFCKYNVVSVDGDSIILANKRCSRLESRSSRIAYGDEDVINSIMFEQRNNNEFNNYEYAAMQFGV